jgi:hypothetical protein
MKLLLFCFFICFSVKHALAMEVLNDADLSSIAGREGVALDLELRVNMTEDGSPLTASDPNSYGTDCAGADSPCRWALSFANRDNLWLVFNGWSVGVKINDVRLDVLAEMDSAAIPGFDLSKRDDRQASQNRFFDVGGNCMLEGCSTVADIPSAIQNMPSMVFTTPASALSYDKSSNTSSGFNNTQIAANLDGAALVTSPTGFSDPVPGTFIGAQVGDVQTGNNFAGWSFKGQVYLYGY